MRNQIRRAVCASLALVLAGCAGPKMPELDGTLYQRDHDELPGRDLPGPDESTQDASVTDLADATGALTLREAMALAVMRSPKLRAFDWEVRRAEAQALQAGLWPNPEFDVEFENFAGSDAFSGTDSLETTVSLAQTFPLGGDIARRRELAGYRTELAGWDYEGARLEVLTEVTQRYIGVLAANRRIEAARDALQLAQQVQTTTKKRVDAGDAPPIEAARAIVPVATARVALKRAERDLVAANKRLSLTWGASKPTFDSLTGSLNEVVPPPPADQLVALINENPAVARWSTEISARRAEGRLAEAEAVPDLTGRIGVRDDQAADAQSLVVGISLPLPIFDRRQGDILAARLGVSSADQRQREAELRIESMLAEAYARLINAYDEATALRDIALPPATEAFDLTRRAFENGDLRFLDVLDAERTLIELRTRYVAALNAYHTATAEIEGLIAQPLAGLADLEPPSPKPTQTESVQE